MTLFKIDPKTLEKLDEALHIVWIGAFSFSNILFATAFFLTVFATYDPVTEYAFMQIRFAVYMCATLGMGLCAMAVYYKIRVRSLLLECDSCTKNKAVS